MMEHVEETSFDAGINRIITAVRFAYASREEKLKMVFDHIDVDYSGGLDMTELTVLAKALVPGGDEAKVQKTLAWLDKDGDRNITFDEFKEPMLKITEKLDDDTFDEAIHKLLQAKGEAAEPDPADDLPSKFGSFVGNMPTHATASQMGIKKLNAHVKAKKKVAMIDCRAAEEREVSGIRNAIAVDIGEFKSVEENGVAAALEKADLSGVAEAELVVVYSAAGLEAGVVAPLVAEKLGVPAHNLCGGIIAWYNAGGEVVDAEGNAVEKVHPGIKRCIGFVRPRKNEFKFGGKK